VLGGPTKNKQVEVVILVMKELAPLLAKNHGLHSHIDYLTQMYFIPLVMSSNSYLSAMSL
jgi:hypothetical protein